MFDSLFDLVIGSRYSSIDLISENVSSFDKKLAAIMHKLSFFALNNSRNVTSYSQKNPLLL